MKTFKHLEFKKKTSVPGSQAVLNFKNDYGISVITGFGSYSNETLPYEIAVLYKGEITYNTPITDDVIGYLTKDEVSELMIQIQKL